MDPSLGWVQICMRQGDTVPLLLSEMVTVICSYLLKVTEDSLIKKISFLQIPLCTQFNGLIMTMIRRYFKPIYI